MSAQVEVRDPVNDLLESRYVVARYIDYQYAFRKEGRKGFGFESRVNFEEVEETSPRAFIEFVSRSPFLMEEVDDAMSEDLLSNLHWHALEGRVVAL